MAVSYIHGYYVGVSWRGSTVVTEAHVNSAWWKEQQAEQEANELRQKDCECVVYG